MIINLETGCNCLNYTSGSAQWREITFGEWDEYKNFRPQYNDRFRGSILCTKNVIELKRKAS